MHGSGQNMKKNKIKAVLVGVFILVAYGVLVGSITSSKPLVMIADIISGLAVIGIAVIMYPFFKVFNKSLSQIYLVLKYIEGILMVVAGIAYLVSPEMRDMIYNNIHIYVFIIGAFAFNYLLYLGKIVPRFISIWGLLGTATIALSTGLKLFGLVFPVLDYFLVLIITNEVFLAVWLMIKGFNPSVKVSKN
jgi:hypothetical protein